MRVRYGWDTWAIPNFLRIDTHRIDSPIFTSGEAPFPIYPWQLFLFPRGSGPAACISIYLTNPNYKKESVYAYRDTYMRFILHHNFDATQNIVSQAWHLFNGRGRYDGDWGFQAFCPIHKIFDQYLSAVGTLTISVEIVLNSLCARGRKTVKEHIRKRHMHALQNSRVWQKIKRYELPCC